MDALYNFLIGPAVWVAFGIFVIGLLVRLAFLYGLSRERDKVFYNHKSLKWALRSIGHWLVPWGSASLRNQPFFSFAFFLFHILLFFIPLFLSAHNILWENAFGVSLWSMSDTTADALTIVMMLTIAFLFFRRIVRPEVRILTSLWDYTLLLLTLAPFVTGFLAHYQWGSYDLMLILHIIFGELLIIIIPFTKLGHMILWFFSRSFIGFEMGERRGARAW